MWETVTLLSDYDYAFIYIVAMRFIISLIRVSHGSLDMLVVPSGHLGDELKIRL